MAKHKKLPSKFPRISVISPSLNKVQFIEQSIKSVLRQRYSNFEHIIVDGGSTDGTPEIIKKYKHIKLICEPDNSHITALNKALAISSGEIITTLNTDDFYEPGAFYTAVKQLNKKRGIYIVVGNCNKINSKGEIIYVNKPVVRLEHMLQPWLYEFPINPSAYFYYKEIHEASGGFNEKVGLVFDYEFLLRVAKRYKLHYINKTLGNFRYYEKSKTYINRENILNDLIKVSKQYWGSILTPGFYQYSISYLSFRFPQLKDNFINLLRKKIALRTRIRKVFKKLKNV